MPETQDKTERLIEAVENLSDDINGLMQVAEEGTLLTKLVGEVQTLRSAIDDVRAEIEWAARNLVQASPSRPRPEPLTSFPVDPSDLRFPEKVNPVSRHDLPTKEPTYVAAPPITEPVATPTAEDAPGRREGMLDVYSS